MPSRLTCFILLLVLVSASPLQAQRRGGLLRRLFNRNQPAETEKDEESKSKAAEKEKSDKASQSASKSPTLAASRDSKQAVELDDHVATFGMGLESRKGELRVKEILPDSDAQRAGLQAGDTLKAMAGISIESQASVQQLAEVLKVGDRVELEILRNGKPEQIYLTLSKTVGAEDDTTLPLPFSEQEEVQDLASSQSPATAAVSILEGEGTQDGNSTVESMQMRRIVELESLVDELRTLVEVQNQEIERLQARVRNGGESRIPR